jgi:hypothetical protein
MSRTEELLSPSLTASDDTRGMQAPWNPQWLVFITFFFGWAPGAALLALNFRKMGMSRWAAATWVAAVVGSVAIALIYSPMVIGALQGTLDPSQQRTTRWIVRGVSAAVALVLAHFQRERYRLWLMTHGAAAPLFRPALAAVLAGGLAELGLMALATRLV